MKLSDKLLFSNSQPVDEVSENRVIPSETKLPEILFITSYPPRECGLATYSYDLITALKEKFGCSFSFKICPIESASEKHAYPSEISNVIDIDDPYSFIRTSRTVNESPEISMVVVQHEFGLFASKSGGFLHFLESLSKPVIIVFHTVLPNPNEAVRVNVQRMAAVCEAIVVMTNTSADILVKKYKIRKEKIVVIPHGTHLVLHTDKGLLKSKYQLAGRTVLSTFGLLSSGKNIETSLAALPAIVEKNPDVIFLIIGKTHSTVVRREGEKYRMFLETEVDRLGMHNHVKFINSYLPLTDLLEYLQLTDVYLFTSKDPNQAVSGTFSYAISCGCPVISTPIPHAREVLQHDAGIIIDFESPHQLSEAVIGLINDEPRRTKISSKGLHQMAFTAWENAAISHALLFQRTGNSPVPLQYTFPAINLHHVTELTTGFGMIQFSKLSQPDIHSGYTLDDNARALIAICQHYQLTRSHEDLKYIRIYFNFIKFCQQSDGNFLNYVSEENKFTSQNNETNLADSNGRAIWALGFMHSLKTMLPDALLLEAGIVMDNVLLNVHQIHSPRAMAFAIKGLYYHDPIGRSYRHVLLVKKFADRLVQMYRHESDNEWKWFESYLTYGNSVLPEAMLCAWLATGEKLYKTVAVATFDFLLSKTFSETHIKIISNKTWLKKGEQHLPKAIGGEQPIDVAYTILALDKFYQAFRKKECCEKMIIAFNWFLGDNHLHQIIYNPCTGGCYDGLEEHNVNLNQGAESTVSYLMARLTMEKRFLSTPKTKPGKLEVAAIVELATPCIKVFSRV